MKTRHPSHSIFPLYQKSERSPFKTNNTLQIENESLGFIETRHK